MPMPSTHEEIQFLVEAGEIRRQTGTSGDEAQAAIALATLRLAIAAERIADAMVGSGDPVAADAGKTPAELLAALRWAEQRLGQ